MKKTIIICLALAIGIFFITGCKKKKKGCIDSISINYNAEAEEDDGSCQYAGTGGNTTIVAKPQHHGMQIISKVGYVDSAFVKFNTENSPGSNPAAYDLVLAGEEGEDHVHIGGMKPGKYYIMMTGLDTTLGGIIIQGTDTFHGSRVSGGIPYTLTQTTGEVELAVPVTE